MGLNQVPISKHLRNGGLNILWAILLKFSSRLLIQGQRTICFNNQLNWKQYRLPLGKILPVFTCKYQSTSSNKGNIRGVRHAQGCEAASACHTTSCSH